jgi:hypothetical protein
MRTPHTAATPVSTGKYPPKSKNFANIQKAPQTTIIAARFREKTALPRNKIPSLLLFSIILC